MIVFSYLCVVIVVMLLSMVAFFLGRLKYQTGYADLRKALVRTAEILYDRPVVSAAVYSVSAFCVGVPWVIIFG
jgi:uncharacterized membrane protein YqiK